VGQSERDDAGEAFELQERKLHPFVSFEPRVCSICHQGLQRGDRKVHAGRCARARKTRLQQLRRQRDRVPKPAR